MITFAEAKEVVYAAEQADWTVGTYMIEDDGWEDATHYAPEALCRRSDHCRHGGLPSPSRFVGDVAGSVQISAH